MTGRIPKHVRSMCIDSHSFDQCVEAWFLQPRSLTDLTKTSPHWNYCTYIRRLPSRVCVAETAAHPSVNTHIALYCICLCVCVYVCMCEYVCVCGRLCRITVFTMSRFPSLLACACACVWIDKVFVCGEVRHWQQSSLPYMPNCLCN